MKGSAGKRCAEQGGAPPEHGRERDSEPCCRHGWADVLREHDGGIGRNRLAPEDVLAALGCVVGATQTHVLFGPAVRAALRGRLAPTSWGRTRLEVRSAGGNGGWGSTSPTSGLRPPTSRGQALFRAWPGHPWVALAPGPQGAARLRPQRGLEIGFSARDQQEAESGRPLASPVAHRSSVPPAER